MSSPWIHGTMADGELDAPTTPRPPLDAPTTPRPRLSPVHPRPAAPEAPVPWVPQHPGLPPATGPVVPQRGIPTSDALPVRWVCERADLWIVGAHGGAGETRLAELESTWRAADHSWPVLPDEGPTPCLLVARTHHFGLLAAQAALTQWAGSGAGPSARLIGLVLVADAPGRLPRGLRDLAKVVAGGAPRIWQLPWIEQWRLGETTGEPHRAVRRLSEQLRSLSTGGQ